MTGHRLYAITAAMMLGLFLASIESTVVATAMPTIVAQLGGLSLYAGVFSVFMFASTTAMVQFSRSIGGTEGVSMILSMRLAEGLVAAGIDPEDGIACGISAN
jgi:hypothetical protein